MVIYQGDQYKIPFTIRHKKVIVTPENAVDVSIALGDKVKSYSDGSLLFNDGKWLFPLTAEESVKMLDREECQVQIKYGDDIVHSKRFDVKAKETVEALKKEIV